MAEGVGLTIEAAGSADGYPLSTTRSGPLEGEALKAAIMRQVEYYLSRENLAKDTYLVNQMNEEAFAPIKLIANFKAVKSMTTDSDLILEAINMSSKLEVDSAGILVRPLDMASDGKKKSTVILRDVDSTIPEEEIRALFDEIIFGAIEKVRSDIGDTWFIELEGECTSDAQMAEIEKIRTTELRGKLVRARVKTESSVRGLAAAGFSPTGGTPGSPTNPGGVSPTNAAYGGYPYQPYGGYYGGAQMYYAPQPGVGPSGVPPQQWVYGGWDQSMAPQQAVYGQLPRMPGVATRGRGRGADRGTLGVGGRGGTGRGAVRGGMKGNGTTVPPVDPGAPVGTGVPGVGTGGVPVPGTGTGTAANNTKKQGGPKPTSPKKADAPKPEQLHLASAMDFPSLPSTPTRAARKAAEFGEDTAGADGAEVQASDTAVVESVEKEGGKAAVATGWAAVARNEPVKPESVPAPEIVMPVKAETAPKEVNAAPAVATAPTPAPAPVPVPEPEPALDASLEPAPPIAGAPKSWAMMAAKNKSAPVKPAAASSKSSGQQVLSGPTGSRPSRETSSGRDTGKSPETGREPAANRSSKQSSSERAPAAPDPQIDMWNEGGEETMPRVKPAAEAEAAPTSRSWADMAKAKAEAKVKSASQVKASPADNMEQLGR